MSRRRAAIKRDVLPDPRHGSKLVARFVNCLMKRGKKSVAEKIVYSALDKLQKERANENVVDLFEKVLDNVGPAVEVRTRRVGGATYPVPMEVRAGRRYALAMRWLIKAARGRSEKSMAERLGSEFEDAINNRGAAVKKREETHKTAEVNKAFAHYRW